MDSAIALANEQSRAAQQVDRFVRRFQPAYLLLAYYAALPLVITPELLNYLRNQFLRSEGVPWVAEVDLLLSDLCRPVGYEQYAMDTAVRAYLLSDMEAVLGKPQIAAASRLLLGYVQHLAQTNPYLGQRDLESQQLAAMVCLDDHRQEAVRRIAESFRQAAGSVAGDGSANHPRADRAEMLRLARLTQELSSQLEQHPQLVEHARLVSKVLIDPGSLGAEELSRLHQPQKILDVELPSLAEVVPGLPQPISDISTIYPPLQTFEFEVATISFDDAPSPEDSEEIHAAAIAWFTDRHIEVRSYSTSGSALASKLDRVALELGEHYEVLSPLLVQIQRAISRSNRFRYQLADAPETTISGCVGFGHTLHHEGLLDEFDYDRATRTLSGVLANQPEVSQFFSGAWFERYSGQKIVRLLQERGLSYSYLVNPVVGLPNGNRLVLDLFFLIENQPFLIECQSGRAVSVSALSQIARYGESLAIPYEQRWLIALELTSQQIEQFVDQRNAIVVSLENFLAGIQAPIESGVSTGSIALSRFEFEVATLVRRQRSPNPQLSQLTIDEIDNVDEIGGDPILNALADEIRATSGQGLSDLRWEILRQTWLGRTYRQIAESLDYSEVHLKKEGAQFFRKLSEVIGEQVTKTNLRSAAQRWFARHGVFTVERRLGQALQFVEVLGDGVTLEMVEIPAGQFVMGAPEGEEDSRANERPKHEVRLERFYMGKYAVTQAQWRAVAVLPQVNRELKADPSNFKGEHRPVESVSWFDAVEFCDRLSQYTGKHYRLPSEAKWEYACRANPVAKAGSFRAGDAVGDGTVTPFHFGETITTDLANYNGTQTYGQAPKGIYRAETTPVGSFPANAFGLCDMHGNVWEWCQDHWHHNYEGASPDGSAWVDAEAEKNAIRVLRGGSWFYNPRDCRSAYRYYFDPGFRIINFGFRVVCSA